MRALKKSNLTILLNKSFPIFLNIKSLDVIIAIFIISLIDWKIYDLLTVFSCNRKVISIIYIFFIRFKFRN